VVKNKTEAAYRRGDLLDKRRGLMEDWERFACGSIGQPSSAIGARRERRHPKASITLRTKLSPWTL
jgi:hypothetical protein